MAAVSTTTTKGGQIGRNAGSSGVVTVEGADSQWINIGQLLIGAFGSGTLNIKAGGEVQNGEGVIAPIGVNGAVLVDGPNARWINSGKLSVFGAGTLNIKAGGYVENTDGVVDGDVTVDGPFSKWFNKGDLTVGAGTLTITDGGLVLNTHGFVGGNGSVTVTGARSVWSNTGDLTVGNSGTGTLNIIAGGIVFNTDAIVGSFGSGTVTVAEDGSTWAVTGKLSMGGPGGTSTLRIQTGGTVSVAGDTNLISNAQLSLEGGTFSTSEISFQGGGNLLWTSGTLHVGTYNGNLANPNGGTLAPGHSAGKTTVNGNYTQQASATLEIEIGGLSAGSTYDLVNIAGTASLGGQLQLAMLGGFVPSAANTFSVFNAAGEISGVFANVANGQRLTTSDGGGSFLVHYGAGSTFNSKQIVLSSFLAVALPGDYNQNGIVDAADYTVWRNNAGTTNPLPNDPIGGAIGPAQYDQWRAHFGQTAGSGSVQAATPAVPEPDALLMALIFAANLPTFWHKITPRRRPSRSCAQARASCSACPSERY